LNAFGLHLKKEETLALISEENVRTNRAKPWISNRQIYVGFGTVLTLSPSHPKKGETNEPHFQTVVVAHEPRFPKRL
jgi:hypothetical protein